MVNAQTIEQIQSTFESVSSKLGNRNAREVAVKELDFKDGTIKFDGCIFESEASKKMFNMLNIKPKFLTETSRQLADDEWDILTDKLKKAAGEERIKLLIPENDNKILDIFGVNEKTQDNVQSYKFYVDTICEALAETEQRFSFQGMGCIDDNISLRLDRPDSNFNVFWTDNSSEKDVWKVQDYFEFNPLSFTLQPELLRLACSNGMMAVQNLKKRNISNPRFQTNRINQFIKNALSNDPHHIQGEVMDAAHRMKNTNVSIAEWLEIARIFVAASKDDENKNKYDAILEKYFNASPFMHAYGVEISSQSKKWLSFANSGINAYDYVNQVTWITSHPDEFPMDLDTNRKVSIAVSNLFFKPQLDLVDIPQAGIVPKVPRVAIMN